MTNMFNVKYYHTVSLLLALTTTMKYLTTILIILMCLYMGHVVWNVTHIFNPTTCNSNSKHCLKSLIYKDNRPWTFRIISSSRPLSKIKNLFDKTPIVEIENFDFHTPFVKNLNLTIPNPTRKNGSMHMHMILFMPEQPQDMFVVATTEITAYSVPVTYFQLMGDSNDTEKGDDNVKPVTHLRPKVLFHVMSQDINLPSNEIPHELYGMLRHDRKSRYLPMLYINEMNYNNKELRLVNTSSKDTMQIEVTYNPLSVGMMRLWVTLSHSMSALKGLGFSDHDTDEVKGIFMDTNIYYLGLTFFVSTFHLLFDFLAFKHDVQYWKNRKSMEGLSSHTVIYRCVSTVIIFLYLVDKKTSLLVVVPTFIGSIIEIWKVTKAIKLRVSFASWRPQIHIDASSERERTTGAFDQEAIKYLSYVLYPLSICGALYSLFYMPHTSWYSWAIESLVNGVYAFGFLFMLPQLFINYKLKSVAHLPWKAFMYKAFNTFIDDVFAFIIRMPTSHRLACFRDDIVFFCYLYQRWLYPIDKTRVNEFGVSYEEEAEKKTN